MTPAEHWSEAERLGHRLAWDPPAAITAIRRWTCTECYATLLDNRGHLYGDATESTCAEARTGVGGRGI